MRYYLNYILRNDEPIRIADDSIAQKGQTGTLHYITGSAMRGYVITKLVDSLNEQEKEELFTKVYFMNAYPAKDETCLLPSPKGFYEDKSEGDDKKRVENVVTDGKDIEGLKRARIGEFASIKDGVITYYSVHSMGELKKRMYGNEMYRNEYVDKGYLFAGAIASDSKKILEKIHACLSNDIHIGSGKGSGMGRCRVTKADDPTQTIPYASYCVDSDIDSECYMMLLSPTSMRNEDGEPVGLNLEHLEEMLGAKGLQIKYCSTSVKKIQGYNRTWNGIIPSMTVYDKGSVFHLTFDGTIKYEKVRELMDKGIGERINEGFGRVLFLKDYDSWIYKERGSSLYVETLSDNSEEKDSQVLNLIARKYYRKAIEEAMDRYIVNNPLSKGTLRSSKTRGIEPILTMNRFNYKRAVELLKQYFGHETEKEEGLKIHKELRSTGLIKAHVFTLIEGNIEELLKVRTKEKDSIMTIPKKQLLNENEIGELKLQFLLKELRFDSRKEGER